MLAGRNIARDTVAGRYFTDRLLVDLHGQSAIAPAVKAPLAPHHDHPCHADLTPEVVAAMRSDFPLDRRSRRASQRQRSQNRTLGCFASARTRPAEDRLSDDEISRPMQPSSSRCYL